MTPIGVPKGWKSNYTFLLLTVVMISRVRCCSCHLENSFWMCSDTEAMINSLDCSTASLQTDVKCSTDAITTAWGKTWIRWNTVCTVSKNRTWYWCIYIYIYINSMVWVRKQTIPTERQPLVGEVIANFCRQRVPRGQRDGSLWPYSRFSRQEPLRFHQVAPQLYSLGWVDPVPDTLLFFSGSAGNRTWASGSVAKNSDH
jgi:hypothetical protein